MTWKLIVSATAGLALLMPVAAFGQVVPRNNNQGQVGVGAAGRMSAQQESWRFESEAARRATSMTEEEAVAEYGAERVELANRVQALIDDGKCREARTMASEAGERQMALRIRQTCRAR